MHEVDDQYAGIPQVDVQTANDVASWRKGERKRLIDERLEVPPKGAPAQPRELPIASPAKPES